jgi:integration host factor beta subunit
MNKSELINHLEQGLPQVPKTELAKTVDVLLTLVGDALAAGERIDIRGFGSFMLRERPARTGRDPRTGETIAIAAKKVPHFKPSKALTDRVNGAADVHP